MTAILAAEALDRRHQDAQPAPREKSRPDRRYLMTVSSTGTVLSTTELSDLEEMSYRGQRFLLLPAE